MERAAGFTHADTGQMKLGKLDAVLAESSTSRQDAALLAEMLSLPNDWRYSTLELSPQQRRQKTLEALIAQIEALSRSNPLPMIFEDVHWIDPTSLEALGRSVDRLGTLGVLLIVTYRQRALPGSALTWQQPPARVLAPQRRRPLRRLGDVWSDANVMSRLYQ
jgi:predicted ATPase